MASDDIGNLLNAGIQAARAGKKAEARRLLEQVLERDDNNEVAWMWFASVVDTPRERRICLENVLEINPNNQQARDALERLGPRPSTGQLVPPTEAELSSTVRPVSSPRHPPAAPPPQAPPPAAPTPAPTASPAARPAPLRPRRRPISPVLLIGGMVVAVGFIIIGLLLASSPGTVVQPTETYTAVAAAATGTTRTAAGGAPTRALPTVAPNATFVEITAVQAATFTPPPTATKAVLQPTPTLDLANFTLYFVGDKRGRSAPGIYSLKGNSTDETLVVKGDGPATNLSVGSSGKLLYVTQVDGKDQIASADPDGSNPTILTKSEKGNLRTPVWSRDGKKIAYVSDQSGVNEIYVMNADGSGDTALTQGNLENRDPAWSPDGTKLIYASDTIGKKVYQLFVMDLATNKSTQLLVSAGSSYSPVWSPDGKQIAFVSTRDRYPNVYVMNLSDKAPRLVSIGGGTSTNRDPAWSPDGKYIVFASDRSGGIFNLFLVTVDGISLRQITKSKDNTYGAQFRPNAL